MSFQEQKLVVRKFLDAFEASEAENVEENLNPLVSDDYEFKGYEPYGGQEGVNFQQSCQNFWRPMLLAVGSLQRREDIFIAGRNRPMCLPKDSIQTAESSIWVMSMGHFMGLFDRGLFGLRPTGKIVSIRYTEFHCVEDGKVSKTGMFLDIIGLMESAGAYPLPPSTGQYFVYPGPKTHDGILNQPQLGCEVQFSSIQDWLWIHPSNSQNLKVMQLSI